MGQPMMCQECNGSIRVTIEPAGSTKLVVFTCRKCGTSYNTNIDYTN